jgi:phosphoglycerate kinase
VNLRSFENADVHGKRVLVRVDFNVPMDGDSIRDDTRIRSAIPTIENLINRGASVVLMSHLGRPKGQVNPKYSLRKVADHLGTLLDKPVKFVDDVVGQAAIDATSDLKSGEILLLENVRFEAGEEKNDLDLARKLAESGSHPARICRPADDR